MMFNLFGKTAPRTVDITPPAHDAIALRGTRLRKGMWVAFRKGSGRLVGILARATDDCYGEVHVVNEAGETVGVEMVMLSAIAQARYRDLPSERIKHLDATVLGMMGYR